MIEIAVLLACIGVLLIGVALLVDVVLSHWGDV